MILVDSAIGSRELEGLIQKQGIACNRASLSYADACFEGYGPEGLVAVGVERKRLQDILNCIDDGRLTGHQLVGMRKQYRFSILIVEGLWKPDTRSGLLLEGFQKPDGTVFWGSQRPTGRKVMYNKLRRYLFSISLSGVMVLCAKDIAQTAYDICELYHYFQKPWHKHTSLMELHKAYFWQQDGPSRDLMPMPSLSRKPPLVRRWAAELSGIGVKLSEDAERVFHTPIRLAEADEMEWLKIAGVGPKTVQQIIQEVRGR